MTKRQSRQRITKIKKDVIEDLLKRAELKDVKDATIIQEAGSDLAPYPDMTNLRTWIRDYLLTGMNKLFPVKHDINGDTYYTTIIDGLPLFTKLAKTIDVEVPEQPFNQPILEANGAIGKDSFAVAASSYTSKGQPYYVTDPDTLNHWQSNAALPQTLTLYTSENFKLKQLIFNNNLEDVYKDYVVKEFKVEGSNDNSQWTDLGTYTNVYTDLDKTEYSFQINAESEFNYYQITVNSVQGEVDNCAISYVRLDGMLPSSSLEVVTSKPGLWLSNLSQPVSASLAGSWLRHNMISEPVGYDDNFLQVNSDTIGNYTYSFFQRGIYKRTSGSQHGDNDSYCQHWSASSLGCISHDAIVIPLMNLRNTYTSYQLPATPANADMQTYEETQSKDITYNFVNNTNNEPVDITQFNGRIVGSGWNYELVFTPNHEGETGGSTGGTVSGSIEYEDNEGNHCTQDIDVSFKSEQAGGNLTNQFSCKRTLTGVDIRANLQNLSLYAPFTNGVVRVYLRNLHFNRDYTAYDLSAPYFDYYTMMTSSSFPSSCTTTCRDCTTIRSWWTGSLRVTINGVVKSSWQYEEHFKKTDEVTITHSNSDEFLISQSLEAPAIGISRFSIPESILHFLYGDIEVEIIKKGDHVLNDIDIYINIVDMAKMYQEMGIPWNRPCGYDRFEVSIGTSPCTESYCTSIAIQKGTNIDKNGIISGLRSGTYTG